MNTNILFAIATFLTTNEVIRPPAFTANLVHVPPTLAAEVREITRLQITQLQPYNHWSIGIGDRLVREWILIPNMSYNQIERWGNGERFLGNTNEAHPDPETIKAIPFQGWIRGIKTCPNCGRFVGVRMGKEANCDYCGTKVEWTSSIPPQDWILIITNHQKQWVKP